MSHSYVNIYQRVYIQQRKEEQGNLELAKMVIQWDEIGNSSGHVMIYTVVFIARKSGDSTWFNNTENMRERDISENRCEVRTGLKIGDIQSYGHRENDDNP